MKKRGPCFLCKRVRTQNSAFWYTSGTSSYCIPCHRKYSRDKMKQVRVNRAKELYAFAAIDGCVDCNHTDLRVLQFHHRDPTTKIQTVAYLVAAYGFQDKRVQQEIAKCDVLCANCHQIREWRDGWETV